VLQCAGPGRCADALAGQYEPSHFLLVRGRHALQLARRVIRAVRRRVPGGLHPGRNGRICCVADRAIAVGAGPQTTYTVQKQPPAGSCRFRYEKGEPLEDPACTPGAISPAVTQANLKSTICRKGGYTSGIRPSTSVTGKEKALNAASYSYRGSMRDAEYDHLLSGVAAL
jgi:hypothetical protein